MVIEATQLKSSTLTRDKLYARKMERGTRHWSGKHKVVVSGINLVTLLWTDGDSGDKAARKTSRAAFFFYLLRQPDTTHEFGEAWV